jgi:polysaccharide export outer membrane protein
MTASHFIALLVSTFLVSFAIAQENEPGSTSGQAELPETYQLAHGDLVSVSVYEEPDLATSQRIDGKGRIRMSLIGKVSLKGLTVREAEERIRETYIRERYLRAPEVTVKLEETVAREFTILGQVKQTGQVPFPVEKNEISIVEAISRAGGLTPIAKGNTVRVTRTAPDGSSEDITVDVDALIQRRGASNEAGFMIRPGDRIFVPERLF